MSITVGVVITAITLFLGEISKIFNLESKYIPIQNVVITIVSSVVCIIFKVEQMSILETILTCIFATMGAGGIYDLTKVSQKT